MFRKCFAIICSTLIFFISFSFSLSFSTKEANASNSSYAVLRTDTNELLLSLNENSQLPMASTTKIMSTMLAIENCLPGELVNIDKRAIGVEGSSVYLKEGESLLLEELLYCIMLRSGNDAAEALAYYMCNNLADFAEMMNIRAKMMGLENTHFVTPHGLHDPEHYTSAKDLALISSAAMKYPRFMNIVKTQKITIGEGESRRTLVNKNKMLNLYEGANGIKTGYTTKAGRCLVSSATKNGITLVCVVLNFYDTYGLSSELLNKGFSMIGINT